MWQERGVALTLVLLTPVLDSPLAVTGSERMVVMGRGRGAKLDLPDPSVSGRHAAVKKRGQAYLLSDEGSLNGTAIWSSSAPAPVFLTPGSPRVLEDGDRILLGHVEILVCLGEPPSEVTWVDDWADLPRELVRAALRGRGLEPGDEELGRALRELEKAPDEPIGGARTAPTEAPSEPVHRPEAVRVETRLTDGALITASLVTLAGGLYALTWLLG
jgi:pSer/pThr/pTyr-binding forkhead associated (FHA) protein